MCGVTERTTVFCHFTRAISPGSMTVDDPHAFSLYYRHRKPEERCQAQGAIG